MDKKNTIIGLLLLGGGFFVMFWQSTQVRVLSPQIETTVQAADNRATDATNQQAPSDEDSEAAQMLDLMTRDLEAEEAPATIEATVPESIIAIANDHIEVEFTNRGGGIRRVNFLQTKNDGRDDYVFNENGYLPALGLGLPNSDGSIREFDMAYAVDSHSAESITFVLQAGPELRIYRTYSLTSATENERDPYIVEHTTRFENLGAKAKAFSNLFLNLGTMRPLSESKMQQSYINVSHFNGDKAKFVAVSKLTGSNGFLGVGASAPKEQIIIDTGMPLKWTSVKNQFFAGILSSRTADAESLVINKVRRAPAIAGEVASRTGITGSAAYAFGIVPAGDSKSFEFEYFIGPKEFKRLQSLGDDKDLVMQFGFLSFISKLLLAFMYAIHAVVPNWGLSIVIMTICIKLIFWPLTAKASRSQKRMASIQGPMAELKEKYKDNPQKMQQETIKLFREHQVNPVAGCLPLIIQMPIFLGLFYMLRTASELRYESFLWISDLSQPDTITEIAGFPINLLPLLMAITMYLQMSMMPVNPTADPMQQKIFKFLPFVFLIFLYGFSSGLVLYWTVQNILTIVQQKITNSRPDEPLKPLPAASGPKSGSGGSPRTKPRRKK